MNRKYKITIAILSVALAIALIGVAVLSGTLTKFATTGSAIALARVAKWGINLEAGSDVSHEYRVVGNRILVSASLSEGVVIPGTRGALTYVKTSGSPEVAYSINVDGDTTNGAAFSVGAGYYASSRLVHDENGLPIEYFPIIIRFSYFDLASSGTKSNTVTKSYAIRRTDVDVNCTDLDDLVTKVNLAINTDLDVSGNPPANNINKVYAIEWDWLYTSDGPYQTDGRDTSLCEAVAAHKNSSLFDIKINTVFEMAQVD